MKCYVYRNLNKGGYSILVEGKVVDWREELCLIDVVFRVRQGGRQRVCKEKQKNVHAFAIGTLIEIPCLVTKNMSKVSYNPYKNKNFVIEGTDQMVVESSKVILNKNGCFALI